MVNLDTHILLAAVGSRLRPAEVRVLQGAWFISGIVLGEVGWLEREERINAVLRTREFARALERTTVFPIDLRVALALRQLDFRSDPADEIIAATSIVHDVPLLTRDSRILGSKVVPLALRG